MNRADRADRADRAILDAVKIALANPKSLHFGLAPDRVVDSATVHVKTTPKNKILFSFEVTYKEKK